MKIEFLRPWRQYGRGDLAEFDSGLAQTLVVLGTAKTADAPQGASVKAAEAPPRDKSIRRQRVSRKAL